MEVTYNRHGSCHKHYRDMKAIFVYKIGEKEHFQEVEIVGGRVDADSLFNYWKASVSHHVPEGAEFVRAYYSSELDIRDVPAICGYYTFRFVEGKLKALNRKYLTLESPIFLLPEPLPPTMVMELAQELVEKKDPDYGWRLVDYSWNIAPEGRQPKPVWVKVNDSGPEFLKWVPGLLYDRGIAYTSMGILTHPDSEEDTRDFFDTPFNGCEIRSV